MAYGLKYYLDYCDRDNIQYRLEILDKDYTGAAFAVSSAGNPFTKITRNEDGNKLTEVQTTSASFNLYEDANLNIDSMLNSSETRFLVKHYIGGVLDCQLFIVPDLYTSDIDGNSVVEFTATDRTPSLKEAGFVYQEGSASFISIISQVLSSTGLSLNINVVANFTCDEWVAPVGRSANLLQDTYVWKDRLFDASGRSVSMYDTLKSIMAQFFCRVYMNGNEWWIVNKEENQVGAGRKVKFNSAGTLIGEEAYSFPVRNVANVDTGGYKEISPVLAVSTIYAENGTPVNLLKNKRFQGFAGGAFPNWNNRNGYVVGSTTVDPKKYNTATGVNVETETLTVSVPSLLQNTSGVDSLNVNQPHMESDPVTVPGTDNKARLTITLRGADDSVVYAMVIAKVTGTSGVSYFYSLSGEGSFSRYDITSVTTNAFLAFHLKQEMREGAVWGGDAIEMTFNVEGLIPNADSRGVTTEVFVRIYGVNRPNGRPYQTNLKNISLEFATQNAGQIKGIIFQSSIAGTYSYKVDAQTAIFNDFVPISRGAAGGIRMANTSSLNSIMHASNGVLTANWNFRSEAKDYQIVQTIKQISRSNGKSHYKLSINTESPVAIALHSLISVCGQNYMVLSYEVNYLRKEVELVIAECLIAPVQSSIIIFGYLAGENDGIKGVNGVSVITPGGSASATPQDLQSVTEQGNKTTLSMETRGTHNTHLLGIPTTPPPAGEMKSDMAYISYSQTAAGGVDPEPGMDFYIKQAQDADLSNIQNGQLVYWDSTVGKFRGRNEQSLAAYATMSWVLTQGFATQNWVNSQGFLKSESDIFATQNWVNSQGFLKSESDTLQSVTDRGNQANRDIFVSAGNGEGFKLENSSITRENSLDIAITTRKLGVNTKIPSTELDVNGIITATGGNSTNWNTAYVHTGTQGNPHNTQFSQLLAKPTTLGGYGITDAVDLFSAQIISGRKTFTGGSSNAWNQTALEIQGNGTTSKYPGIAFHQPGIEARVLNMRHDARMYLDDWRIYDTRDFTFDINATPYTMVQRDGSGYIHAQYISLQLTKAGFNPALINGLLGFNNVNGDEYAYQFSQSAVNQFLGMPAGGDTLQSVTNRGSFTTSFVKFGGLSNIVNGDGIEFFFDTSSNTGVIQAYGRGTSNAYQQLVIGASVLTLSAPLISASGKITCPVIEPTAFILPTASPSNPEAGKWYLTIETN